MSDSVSAYEKNAHDFLVARDNSNVGVVVMERWARSLAPGADVLEIACGGGLPVTRTLLDAGLNVWAMDSSPTLVAEFHLRFPDVPVECSRIQDSDCFNRPFDAVVAIGLMFLLSPEDQQQLIARVANGLNPAGRFLFTAPVEKGGWQDLTTGIESVSLGKEAYGQLLREAGFRLAGQHSDAGGGNYYDAVLASG